MQLIDNVDGVVEALGGDTVVAKEFEITPAGVNHWKSREHIPGGWQMPVFVRLLSRGLFCDPVVFGLSREEADVLLQFYHPSSRHPSEPVRSAAHA